MTPAENERALTDAFSIIPDPHERLAAIVSSCGGPGIPDVERREDDLVPGCVSRVWLTASVENGVLQLRWDADSPLVKGLTGLICRISFGSIPKEAAVHETAILINLHLDRQLSPTRLNGLDNVARRIRLLAAGAGLQAAAIPARQSR